MSLIEIESYKELVGSNGPEDAEVLIVIDSPATADEISKRPLSGEMGAVYLSQFRKFGINQAKIRVESVALRPCPKGLFYTLPEDERTHWRSNCFKRIQNLVEKGNIKVIVPAGDEALRLLTGKSSLQKWHMSPLRTTEAFGEIRAIPLLSPHYVMKVFRDIIYVTLGAKRISECLLDPKKQPIERNFIIRPTFEQIYEWKEKNKNVEWLSIDIETSAGQINCIGFSSDSREAICIPSLPTDWTTPEQFFAVWQIIRELCESRAKKTGQNIIYDATYLSAYGVRILNIQHDTMIGIRYSNPELKKGLDNNARIYMFEPYWKDEGKDWNSRQNIDELYYYNCKDAAGTLEITQAQIQELKEDSQYENFQDLAMKLWAPCAEMSWTGFPVNLKVREELKRDTEEQIKHWTEILNREAKAIIGKEINPRSPKQVKEFLKAAGFKLLKKQGKETSNYESLLTLRLKSPESKILEALIKLSSLQKSLSSYLNYRFDEEKLRMFYSIYPASTETLRMTSGLDPWDRGMNIQTIPRKEEHLKRQFGYE